MHPALHIPEILLDIFCYFSTKSFSESASSADLAVLARTCRTFKEPALDLLWEELDDLSPLACCLPEACCLAEPPKMNGYWWTKPRYTFSRPLKEAEWIALRSYARRVRSIRCSSVDVTKEFIREVFSLAPFDNPLFPHLRSLHWNGTATSALSHIVAPSLKILHLYFAFIPGHPTYTEPFSFNNLGDHFRRIENLEFEAFCHGPMNLAISDLVCCWSKLQRVACSNVVLNMNAISHLSSMSSLNSLKFKAGTGLVQDISHLNSKLVFSSLAFLEITSKFLDTITSLLLYTRLPAIKTLSIVAHEEYISRRGIQLYWAAVREACQSNVPAYLRLSGSLDEEEETPRHEEPLSSLTLDVLPPCIAFANLRGFDVDVGCPVSLSDADVLDLVSPRMEYLLINYERGWQNNADSGGVTLRGLVRLLRKCPSLNRLCLAIDTRTFTEIPKGLDISFPARRPLEINIVDSYILPEFVPGLVSVFTLLGLEVSTSHDFYWNETVWSLWQGVSDGLRDRL